MAFLASAQLVALGVNFGRSGETELDDLYISDMHEGLTRGQALRPLTQVVDRGRKATGRSSTSRSAPTATGRVLDVRASSSRSARPHM